MHRCARFRVVFCFFSRLDTCAANERLTTYSNKRASLRLGHACLRRIESRSMRHRETLRIFMKEIFVPNEAPDAGPCCLHRGALVVVTAFADNDRSDCAGGAEKWNLQFYAMPQWIDGK